MSFGDMLGGIFGSGDAEKFGQQATNNAQRGVNDAKKYRQSARSDVQTGTDLGQVPLQQAAGVFDPLLQQKQGGFDMYLNSLGLNGQAGNDAAVGAFQNGPGYQAALSQGLEALMRNSAASGNLNSGNNLMALSDYGRNQQNLEYGSWQDRLQGLDPSSLYGQKAAGLSNLGQFLGNQYNAKSNAGLQGGQLVQGANGSLTGAIGQQANIAGSNAGMGWDALLGIGSLATKALLPKPA